MKIIEQTPHRLVLDGTPGGKGTMLALVAVGALISIVTLLLGAHFLREGHYFPLLPIGFGLLVAQVLFWIGTLTLAFGRERLVLDRTAGRGEYAVTSPVIEVDDKPCQFDWANLDSVALEVHTERQPRGLTPRPELREVEVYRLRLRLNKPRRAITLTEGTGEAGYQRAKAMADEVCPFLDLQLVDFTSETEDSDSADSILRARERRALASGRGDWPEQPAPTEWDIQIDEENWRIALSRIKHGGPPVFGCFLVLLTIFAIIAVVLGVAAWLPGQTFNGDPMPDDVRVGLAACGLFAVIAVVWSWISLFRGHRRIVIDSERITTFWSYPGRRFIHLIPGAARIFAREQSFRIAEIESVRIARSPDQGHVVELRSGTSRLRIASTLDDESKEASSVKWLASFIRHAIEHVKG